VHVDWKATRLEKFALIEQAKVSSQLDYQTIQPDKKHTWLTEGLHSEFDDFMPLGTKETKSARDGKLRGFFLNCTVGE
jgi:predicted helicase